MPLRNIPREDYDEIIIIVTPIFFIIIIFFIFDAHFADVAEHFIHAERAERLLPARSIAASMMSRDIICHIMLDAIIIDAASYARGAMR